MNPQSEIARIFSSAIDNACNNASFSHSEQLPKSQQEACTRYRNVQALHQRCTIRVERIEVTIGLEGGDPRDSYFDRTGYLTDDQTQRAYDILLDNADVCARLDVIAMKLAKGEL